MTEVTDSVKAEDRPFETVDWTMVSAISVIWGSSFLFMAIGLESFEPGLVSLLRVGFGAATAAFLPGARKAVPREAWPRIVVLGFVWLAFPLTLFPIAQQWIDSSVAGMLNSAMPLMTLFIAWAAFSTPTGPRRLFGVLVGLVGIVLIGAPEASTAGTNAVGVLLVVLAVSSYGLAANIAGPLQRAHGSLPVISRALMVATLFSVPLGLYAVPASSFSWSSLAACAAVGVGGTGIAYSLAATLVGRVGAVRMSIVTYIIPVVSVVLGVALNGETVSGWAIVGTGVVLAGALLSSRVD